MSYLMPLSVLLGAALRDRDEDVERAWEQLVQQGAVLCARVVRVQQQEHLCMRAPQSAMHCLAQGSMQVEVDWQSHPACLTLL